MSGASKGLVSENEGDKSKYEFFGKIVLIDNLFRFYWGWGKIQITNTFIVVMAIWDVEHGIGLSDAAHRCELQKATLGSLSLICKRHIIWKSYCYFQYLKVIAFKKNRVISEKSCHSLKITTHPCKNTDVVICKSGKIITLNYLLSRKQNLFLESIMLILETTSWIRIFVINC